MIKPLIDHLSILCSQLSDEELKSCIKSIVDDEFKGIVDQNGYFMNIVRTFVSKGVPADVRMIERSILLEAGRRFHNT